MSERPMIEEESWDTFRASGLVWWVNRILHTFGWALVFEVENPEADYDDQIVTRCYPARCRFRGFSEESETRGFAKLTAHIEETLPRLKEDLEA